jgi:hypothetical protein
MAKTKIYFKNNQAYFKSGGRFFPLPKAQGGLFLTKDDLIDPFTGKPHPPHTIYTNDKNNPHLQMYNDSLLVHRTGSIRGKYKDRINGTTLNASVPDTGPNTPLGQALYRLKKANQRIPVLSVVTPTGWEHPKPTHPVVLIGSNTNNTSTTPVDYSKTPAGRLIALGMPASFKDRAKYAKELGMINFSGTPNENAAIADAMESKARDKVFKKNPTESFTDADSEEADYPHYNYGGPLPKAQLGQYTWGTGNVSAPTSKIQNTEPSSVNYVTPSNKSFTYEGRTFPETEVVSSRLNDPDLVLRNPIDTFTNDYKNKPLGMRAFPWKYTDNTMIDDGYGYGHNNMWMSKTLNLDEYKKSNKKDITGVSGHVDYIMNNFEENKKENPTLYLIKKNLNLPKQKKYSGKIVEDWTGNSFENEKNYIDSNVKPKGYTYQDIMGDNSLIQSFTPDQDTLLGSITLTPDMWKDIYDSKSDEEAKRKLFKMADVSPEEEKNFDNTFIHMNLNNPKQFNTYKKVQKSLPNTNWDEPQDVYKSKKEGGRIYRNYLPKAQSSLDLSNLPMQTITGTQIPTNPIAVQTGAMPPPDSGANNWQQFTNFAKENPTTMAAGTGMLSGIASNFTNKSSNNIDPLIKGQMSGYNNDKGASTANTLLDTAASLDPTGTMKLVNMGVKAGKAVGNLVANKDKYGISQSGAQEAISNVFDPIGFVQDSFNVGKQHGFGQGLKNFATLGVSGRKLQEEAKDDALDRIDYKDMAERAGTNKGNYRNDSVYAKRGVNLSNQTLNNKKKPNVEIEDGEIMLGTPGAVTKYGNASTSLNSKFAAKFHGDEHGEDTDKDGMEGIPLNAPGGYIASNYLGMDGRKVKKQNGGKMGPTVADEMTPLVNYLHEAEQDSQDGYKNNPVAIKQVLRQLENMKNTAEVNKWRREVEKMFKDDSIPIEEILTFIQENAPADDMNPEQLAALQGMMPQGQPQMQSGPQQQPQDQLAQMAQQAEQIQPTAKNGLNMNNRFYNRYQQGGPMMNPQDEQAPNPSSNRMEQLMQQSQQTPPSATNPAMQDMDPEVQQMFAQLPPELQDQIMQMPPEQMEIAIMNAFEQMQGQGQQMPPEGMEGGQEQMDPAAQEQAMMEQAMMAEQQALMQLGGYAGDQYRDKNYSYPNSQSPNSANAHLPRPVLQENFNPATKTHTQPFAAFQDRYQTGGAISNDMVQMVQQLIQQGYSQEQAIEVAKNKLAQESQPEMKHGGMVGKTVRFKSGGKIVQGKIKSYDNNTGNFELY